MNKHELIRHSIFWGGYLVVVVGIATILYFNNLLLIKP